MLESKTIWDYVISILPSITALFIAVFDDSLKHKFFHPIINLEIDNPRGEKTLVCPHFLVQFQC